MQSSSDPTVTHTMCVEFDDPQITGYEVLNRSGLDIVASGDPGAGAVICAIEGTGCLDAENCFCAFPPNYWSYWHLVEGAWQFSGQGAGAYEVSHGDVEGWSWGGQTQPPPGVAFDEICKPVPSHHAFLPAVVHTWFSE